MDNKNFDDAYSDAQKMFEESAPENTEDNQLSNVSEDENNNTSEESNAQPENDAMLADAANVASEAANVAKEKDMELQEVLRENEQLKGAVSSLRDTISQMSEDKKEEIIEDALQIPSIDFNQLAFADEETQKNAQAKFIEDITKYAKESMLKELSPFIDEAKKGILQKQKKAAIDELALAEDFNDIKEMLPQIERILENNEFLSKSEMPLMDKIVNAYVIAKGIDKMNTPPPAPPKELTAEELLSLYENNPEFQNLVEQKRIEKLKQSQQVPPFSASSGAGNIALNIKDKPKSFDEILKRLKGEE